jgi:iron-sulfur cluster repair protein YtfE (RIC family)
MPSAKSQRSSDAIKLLTADHKAVDRLFAAAEAGKTSAKRAAFFEIKAALEAHAWIEETIFYPTLQATGDKKLIDMVSEAIQEHIAMKCFLGELAAVSADSAKFEPLLAKLIDDVRHHVVEEEGEIFPYVEKKISADTLNALGATMQSEKSRFQSSAETIYG